MQEIYRFTVPLSLAESVFRDAIVEIGEFSASISIPGTDLRMDDLCERQRYWKRSGYEGEPAFWSWDVARNYSVAEEHKAALFRLIVDSCIGMSANELGFYYISDGSHYGLAGHYNGRPIKRTSSKIYKLLSGEIVLSESLVSELDSEYRADFLLHRILDSRGCPAYIMDIRSPFVRMTDQTLVGEDPFDGGPICDVSSLSVISEIHVMRSSSLRGRYFMATEQKVGLESGDLRPERQVLVSSDVKKSLGRKALGNIRFERVIVD